MLQGTSGRSPPPSFLPPSPFLTASGGAATCSLLYNGFYLPGIIEQSSEAPFKHEYDAIVMCATLFLQEAAITGRIAAAESTNAHLQQLYLPNQAYGALSSYRAELLAAATTKLEHRKNAAMQRLELACQSLSAAEECLRYALQIKPIIAGAGVISRCLSKWTIIKKAAICV